MTPFSTTPVSRLPVEIFYEIFRNCAEELIGHAENIKISHVCRHWRALVLGMPTIWTNIAVRSPSCSKGDYERIKNLVQRTKNLPLRLRLEYSPGLDAEDSDSNILGKVCDLLGQQPIKSLEIKAFGSLEYVVRYLQQVNLHHLATLSLQLSFTPIEEIEGLWPTLFSRSKITSLHWDGGVHIPEDDSWARLKRLTLTGAYPSFIIETILLWCRDLETLQIESVRPSRSELDYSPLQGCDVDNAMTIR